jgi:hypothetical protein
LKAITEIDQESHQNQGLIQFRKGHHQTNFMAGQNTQTKWNGQIFGWAAIRQDLSIIFNKLLSTTETVD